MQGSKQSPAIRSLYFCNSDAGQIIASIGMIKIITMRYAKIQTIARHPRSLFPIEMQEQNRKHWYDKNNNYALCKDPNNRPRSAVFISAGKAGQKRKHWYDKNNNYALMQWIQTIARGPRSLFLLRRWDRIASIGMIKIITDALCKDPNNRPPSAVFISNRDAGQKRKHCV